ncbi:hypothetical protein HPB51_019749 [Rhipicephalus microplus]|uniref:Phosphatidylethanolamine-binding protein n=1 Tax=Rhipicephalus microplus TaxID=6941 RepID=A0A9J6F8T5_RHIMP|nr:protein D1-like [Rhipicephalus microplus]KAH8042008.1 hypothetical protein HPB51_019749 [Rhipicephalus microplus]
MTLAKPSTLLFLLVVTTTWQPSIQETAKEGSSVGGSGSKTKVEPMSGGITLPDLFLWRDSGIVTDLGMDDAPHALLDVQYGNLLISELNQTYTPAQTSNAPTVKLRGYLRCGPPFSLLMVDPDAPSRKQPTKPSVSTVHWMVLNANSDEKFHEGDEAVSYRGPKPPRGSGPHRYVLLVYCQDGQILSKADMAPSDRRGYKLSTFGRKLKTKLAVAGAFFYAENK